MKAENTKLETVQACAEETPAASAPTVERGEEIGVENGGQGPEKAVDLGKFKSVDALLRAYGELEAEFTRRSQRLKALEERNKEREEPMSGQTEPLSIRAQAQNGEKSEELYRAVMENESVRARVLSDYLRSLNGVPLLAGSGSGVSAPVSRPKSFAEAGNLALGYFKNSK